MKHKLFIHCHDRCIQHWIGIYAQTTEWRPSKVLQIEVAPHCPRLDSDALIHFVLASLHRAWTLVPIQHSHQTSRQRIKMKNECMNKQKSLGYYNRILTQRSWMNITVSLEMNTFTTLILVLKLEKLTLKNAIYQEKYLGRTSNFMEGSTDSHKGALLNNIISRHCLFIPLNL